VNNRSRSHLQSSPKGAKVRGNHVTTAKYNLLSFLPKSLFEQYRRAANLCAAPPPPPVARARGRRCTA